MADNRLKLAQGLRNLPAAAREDLASRAADIERGKTVELLRRAGKEMYDNPIVNTAIGFTPVLGDVQAAGETLSALGRGAPWQETAGYAAGMLPFVPMIGKTVWHGSPHSFDKFDLSKIGTGEGAQSYGHGLYLAEARPTAENYRQSLTMDERIGGFKPGKAMVDNIPAKDISQDVWEVADQMASRNMNVDEYINHLKNKIASSGENVNRGSVFNELLEQANKVKPELTGKNVRWEEPGSLYKVNLPDEQIAKMLDWDKPFAEQPQNVQDAITKYWQENRVYGDPTKLTGEGIYGSVQGHVLGNRGVDRANRSAAQEAASMDLNYLGVPGIQYLDQASRGAGEGTRNYVVFSDEIPQILERNNQPVAQALREYRGAHTAPGPEFGAQLHDLTGGGQMYPDDVYSANAYRFYGHGGPDVALDKETTKIAQSFRGKPDEMVSIYRAVPNQEEISTINPGDWITINPNYAKVHGESVLGGNYKILEQKVPAKSVWTNADSIHEYGYWPE